MINLQDSVDFILENTRGKDIACVGRPGEFVLVRKAGWHGAKALAASHLRVIHRAEGCSGHFRPA